MYSILDVLKIKTEEDLFKAFSEFETELNQLLQPIRDKLKMQVLTQDVPQLETHMTYVESWRDRVTQYLSVASAFVEQGKSSYFLLPTGKGVTTTDREAYIKKLTAGFVAVKIYLEELVRSLDSRVNLCKKLLGIESEGNNSRTKWAA